MLRLTLLAAAAALGITGPGMAQDATNDAALDAAMSHNNVMTVRNVTRLELARGVRIFDAGGRPVGTVDHLSGNDVILASGTRRFSVPITEFFAYNQYGKDYFATRASRAALEARASTAGAKPLAAR